MNLPWEREALRASRLARDVLDPAAVEEWLAPPAAPVPRPLETFNALLIELLRFDAGASAVGDATESAPALPSANTSLNRWGFAGAALASHDAAHAGRTVDRAALGDDPPSTRTERPEVDIDAFTPAVAAPSGGVSRWLAATAGLAPEASWRATTTVPDSGGSGPLDAPPEQPGAARTIQTLAAGDESAPEDASGPTARQCSNRGSAEAGTTAADGTRRSRMLRLARKATVLPEGVTPAPGDLSMPEVRHMPAREHGAGSAAGTDAGQPPDPLMVMPLRVPATVSDVARLLQRHVASSPAQASIARPVGRSEGTDREQTDWIASAASPPALDGPSAQQTTSPNADELMVDRVLEKLDERLREEWVRSYGTMGGIS